MVKLMTFSRSLHYLKFRQKFGHKSRISPISCNFVKNQYFRHDGHFSSFRQFFVENEILCSLCRIAVT